MRKDRGTVLGIAVGIVILLTLVCLGHCWRVLFVSAALGSRKRHFGRLERRRREMEGED